ncbi:hypothetical protein ZYGR_0K00430 [Zygosaccharomyces rouxii]|uniref:DNA damage checkpoint protein LCD1 n=1 Tax=Zygosaccharomyces rouxii TaxID=4956 RepID=A0A1Q2ZYQ3_ZYGRO|nr:hypothetical protein ZYGR_0K00430 [Zygosaccharomyces rouxii]
MSDGLDGFSSDEDDDLILQLSTKPPKSGTQLEGTQLETVGVPMQQPFQMDQNTMDQLSKAQGEASMLRDKIALLSKERDRERQQQEHLKEELENLHSRQIDQLKLELQNVEDEKKFLAMEIRKSSSSAKTSQMVSTPSKTDDQAAIKKRKIEHSESRKNYVQLNLNRIPFDETASFYDFLVTHKAVGSDITTVEILNRLRLDYISEFRFKNLSIPKGESLGQPLMKLILRWKKDMALDKFIDTLLEHLAALIKEITSDKMESKIAVPFLVTLMHQAVVFRPSAVHTLALRDLLLFTCDLIRAYQHVLKQPLHDSLLDIHVEPQIFQYEMIDILVIQYSFDVLEATLGNLRYQSSEMYDQVLDKSTLKLLEQVYKLALPISYKPVINVIFNTVEILNILSGINLHSNLISAEWWRDCTARLYIVLSKPIKNYDMFAPNDTNNLHFSVFHDCFSLNRNVGTNQVGKLIPKMIHRDKLQGMPRIISKEDLIDTINDPQINLELERWLLRLKMDILNIFDNLLIEYPNIGNGEMLIQLTKFISSEQELMIHRCVGQDSTNLDYHSRTIERLLTLMYALWTRHQSFLKPEQVKEVESELVMALWRIIEPRDHKEDSMDLRDSGRLVNYFQELNLKDQVTCFDDALEDMPAYVERELKTELNDGTAKTMQVRYDDMYQDMARSILESKLEALTSVDDIDSLYLAMGV